MTGPRGTLRGVVLFVMALAAGMSGSADSARLPEDALSIEAGMRDAVALLDAPEYMKRVTTGEHVVLCYQLAQGREPTPEEFLILSELYGGPGFTRGEILGVALRGDDGFLTWDHCRRFLAAHGAKDFQGSAGARAIALRLAKACASQIAEMETPTGPLAVPDPESAEKAVRKVPVPNESYNVYLGYLHSHSELSDGTGTALEAYVYARDVARLDYFSLTDHSELMAIWPWENKWEQLQAAAEATNAPGKFVTLWGFEWSNPVLGHINVLNSRGITSALDNFGLDSFYRWLAGHPGAFGLFNHPGYFDSLGVELHRLRRCDDVVDQMVGIEVANENESLDRYYYAGSWNSDFSYWDEGNLKGWQIGPVIGQDNHSPDWGTHNAFRTAVLAKELTREAIIDAYENRRFYATENTELRLDFRCSGYPMGSSLSGVVPRMFTVEAGTAPHRAFQQVRLFRDGVLLEARAVSGNPVTATFEDPAYSGESYYYVIVTETVDTDGNGRNDEAISSPIWLEGPSKSAPACGTVFMGISALSKTGGYGDWTLLFVLLAFLAAGHRIMPAVGVMRRSAAK